MDTCNNNLIYGVPLNAYNESYYPGGSSGGSSSAVSCGIVPIALGCDGGGSIRLPSSWCGIYGLKTSHGRISTRPYVTRATSTSVAGPMAANMVDLEVAYRVMAQPDPEDNINSKFPLPLKSTGSSHPKKIGIYKIWNDRADPPVKAAFQKAVDYFVQELKYEVVEITIPYIHEGQMAHALTILNEATSTLTDKELSTLAAPNQMLITVGRCANVTEFLSAQRIRNLLMQHLAFIFERHPGILILTPTTPNPGWPIHPADSKYGVSDGNRSIRNMEYVWLANFTGLPSITAPVGFAEPVQGKGMVPIGLMATAEWGAENELIEFGYEAEVYLNKKLDGGRVRPDAWVDTLAAVEEPLNSWNAVNGEQPSP
jgi:Asp-tRNA(Asn)/Glu-tRNA(Gln) amidotransferase A subunit family amidase